MTLWTEVLVERGLVAPEQGEELRRVTERFAVAVTDDMAASKADIDRLRADVGLLDILLFALLRIVR